MMAIARCWLPHKCSILFLLVLRSVEAFSFQSQRSTGRSAFLSRCRAATADEEGIGASVDKSTDSSWMHCGLLFSSFTDGLENNEKAKSFLRRGILRSLFIDARSRCEQHITDSVVASPCNGPNVERLVDLERIDAALQALDDDEVSEKAVALPDDATVLRLVYIPTALYALRRDSTNTPGKQRQRARADGKKRRNQLVEFLRQELPQVHAIAAVTLDLDDASIKQPEGPTDHLPTGNGHTLLDVWQPHLLYVEGGNTFWLHHCIEKGDWWGKLRKYIVQSGTVYCGKSAGAIITGTVADTAYWKGWDDPLVVPGWNEKIAEEENRRLPGLDLLGGARSIFPHMDDRWQDIVSQRRETLDHGVELLDEFDVLCVDGDRKMLNMFSSENAS